MQPDNDAEDRARALMRSRRYIGLLVIAGVLGVPIAAVAYGFLELVKHMETWVFVNLPHGLGFAGEPPWWPLIPLAVASLVVAATIRFLPGQGGEIPAEGFKTDRTFGPADFPGIVIAAIASVGLGPVVGPEAPLIAIGSLLAIMAVRMLRRGFPEAAVKLIGATGSFAAVSTLLGSPLIGAFLLMEVAGLAGATATAVLLPGFLSAGIGALIFTGLDSLTGQGTFTLAIPGLPTASRPTGADFGWSLLIGVAAALLCWALRRSAFGVLGVVRRWRFPVTLAIGLAVAGLAIAYAEITSHSNTDVLFSGENQIASLVKSQASYSVGALLLIVAFKSIAYAGSLAAFRGGPTFPALFIGAAGGIAMSHLPGLDLVSALGMGISAMSVGMLRLPLTSVLLGTLLLGSDGVTVTPQVIVAVVVCYVITIRLPMPEPAPSG